ncbi:xanthine dehydrogenase family protein molybdopterin-binding subunit [Solicola gregarius]|uniref:Xanthine dehydrogenase family protein molybdopterin-binding subunit n=1 Tax=Solicola gregarius TaxID=2908642 RepID=A0AA46TEC5_9ACTN|nr:xanthine dehydrogenase family protein molybdopterin-binding subunit [Solicola gregarius]UYM03670.1 xanthine dehydrogenase family protein molybdopterin-binding subunit [Solicola gregarius]
MRRVEDPDLVRGRATFVDNGQPAGVLHAAFVRSTYAHARIASIDTAEARELPGVVAVYTAADLDLAPFAGFSPVNEACSRAPLATDRVRFVGDTIALVVAESVAAAADALELVDADLEPLPVVTDPESAVADGSPLQFEELGSNIAAGVQDDPAVDVLADADHVVRARVENQRVAVAPIEGNAVLVEPGDERLTVHVSTQMPHLSRSMIAKTFGLDPDAVRVVAPHVGGAFGGKPAVIAEHVTVIAAARRLGRPVKWTETRSEAMLSMHGRDQVQYAELGLRRDGTFTGMRWRVVGDCGAYAGFGGALALGPTRTMAQGVYEIPAISYSAIAAMTNTTPVGAFRGAGRPESAALLERIIDIAADELGIDPVELRRRNVIPPDAFPYTTRTGATYDNGDYDLPLREALRIAGYDELLTEQQRRRTDGDVRQLGVGIALYAEVTGGGSGEYGFVEVHPDATVTAMAGTSAHGQGHATAFSMLVAERLGIPIESVAYVQSDTARVPRGSGTGGSRSLQLGGNAVLGAADAVLEQARGIAASMLEASSADVQLDDDGAFTIAGVPNVSLRWAEVATYAAEHQTPLRSGYDFAPDGATFPFGAHVSVVEVDTETGQVTPVRHIAVDDCGRVLNPLLVQGQQHGGAAQGVAQALWEEFVYDEDGTPLTSTFADYALPTAADVPPLEVSNTETPTPMNPLGAKGIGESASVGSTPAVQNAVVDAVSHLGVRHIDMPCSPDRVWRAIESARRGEAPELWRDPPKAFDTLPIRGRAGTDEPETADI